MSRKRIMRGPRPLRVRDVAELPSLASGDIIALSLFLVLVGMILANPGGFARVFTGISNLYLDAIRGLRR